VFVAFMHSFYDAIPGFIFRKAAHKSAINFPWFIIPGIPSIGDSGLGDAICGMLWVGLKQQEATKLT
jgi:hypothetical protein